MQERHSNYIQYVEEQSLTTQKHVIPFIEEILPVNNAIIVGEIGCGQGGNLKPFIDMGCKAIGVDISTNKIKQANAFFKDHPQRDKITFIENDIYKVGPDVFANTDLIIMRDTLEHIPDQDAFLAHLFKIIPEKTIVFIGFPPWRMPFAGHQQVCKSRFLSKLPYFHLLPRFIYKGILKMFGEPKGYIGSLMEIRDTRLSLFRFKKIVKKNRFHFLKHELYLVNPNYEIKFKMKPRKLPALLNIPYFKDFISTTSYAIIKKNLINTD